MGNSRNTPDYIQWRREKGRIKMRNISLIKRLKRMLKCEGRKNETGKVSENMLEANQKS